MPSDNFDVIIIGAGQGAALARMMAEAGKKVCLIEKAEVGGTCVNTGCTPTKAHVAAAKRAQDARSAASLGVHAAAVRVNLHEVAERSAGIAREFREGGQKRLAQTPNLTFIAGRARFSGPARIVVTGSERALTAEKLVLATGSSTVAPQIDGLNSVPWLDHAGMLRLRELPRHLLIVGGGYIACEFAQMFRRFGSEVTIIQRGPRLLSREDDEFGDAVAAIFRDEGIGVRTGAQVKSVRTSARGIEAELSSSNETVVASHLLIAAGRRANTLDLGLERTSVRLDGHGMVQTDEFLQAAPGIYALGDVKGGAAFTHVAFDDARILREILLTGAGRSVRDRLVPSVVFTDPQLARVGLNQKLAKAANQAFRLAALPMADTARGLETGETKGLLQALVDPETGRILGASFLGREAGEVMTVLQVAMLGQLPYTSLRDGMFAHPTLAESLNNLFLAMDRDDCTDSIKTTTV